MTCHVGVSYVYHVMTCDVVLWHFVSVLSVQNWCHDSPTETQEITLDSIGLPNEEVG